MVSDERFLKWNAPPTGSNSTTHTNATLYPGLLDFRDTAFFGCQPYLDVVRVRLQHQPSGVAGIRHAITHDGDEHLHARARLRPGASDIADLTQNTGVFGRYFKQSQWTQPTERILVADARSWYLIVHEPVGGVILPQTTVINAPPGFEDSFDRYRHGKRNTPRRL